MILFSFPIACIDLLKYFIGQSNGEQKMTDLVRATIIVDAEKPW